MSTRPVLSNGTADRAGADKAYHRAWWSLVLYPLTFAAAFALGDGLLALLTGESQPAFDEVAFWQVVVAATPALLVFVVPGVLAVLQGRKAMELGRPEGKVPAIVGATIGLGFVALNLTSYVVGLVAG